MDNILTTKIFDSEKEAIAHIRSLTANFTCVPIDEWVVTDGEFETLMQSYQCENHREFLRYALKYIPSKGEFIVYKDGYFKSNMIGAAEIDDLDTLIDNIKVDEKMISFALDVALKNKSNKVVKYLADNFPYLGKHIWNAIRYHNDEMLQYFIKSGFSWPEEWLAYCLYNKNLSGLKIMIDEAKRRAMDLSKSKTDWYRKEMYNKGSDCVKFLESMSH